MNKLCIFLSLIFSCLFSFSQSPVCGDIGFENLPVGANTSTAWISSYQAQGSSANNPICGNYLGTAYVNSASTASVLTTPIINSAVFDVLNSPFGGTKVTLLNYGQYASRTRIIQNFEVDSTHFMYNYAYKALLDNSHFYCDAGYLCFNFYDCNNNPIPALSYTISATSYTQNAIPFLWAAPTPATPGLSEGTCRKSLFTARRWCPRSVSS